MSSLQPFIRWMFDISAAEETWGSYSRTEERAVVSRLQEGAADGLAEGGMASWGVGGGVAICITSHHRDTAPRQMSGMRGRFVSSSHHLEAFSLLLVLFASAATLLREGKSRLGGSHGRSKHHGRTIKVDHFFFRGNVQRLLLWGVLLG